MITKLDTGHVFVNTKEVTNIASVNFSNKNITHLISSFSEDEPENDWDLSFDTDPKELFAQLVDSFNFDPDGYLVFISNEYSEAFISLAHLLMLKPDEEHLLNYDNGGISETFVFHQIDEGMIVELLDPEAFSPFFKHFIHTFKELYHPSVNDFIVCELHHMFTKIQYIFQYDDAPTQALCHLLTKYHFQHYIPKNI